MATNRRMISKSISTSIKLSRVSDFAALLFTWLIPHCDDNGNMDGEPYLINGIVCPLRKKTIDEVESALKELESQKLISFYEKNGRFVHVERWKEHQTLRGDRPDFRYPSGKQLGNQSATSGKRNVTKRNLTEHNITYTPPFLEFWNNYPNKTAKGAALKAWERIKPDAKLQKVILEAIENHKQSSQWKEDNGRFIPHPATWLNQRRWEDEIKAKPKLKTDY